MAMFCLKILFIFVLFFIKSGWTQTCPSDRFLCEDNSDCIKQRFRCDGISFCTDDSDEANCDGNCAADEFECVSGACIPLDMRCNRRDDCAGGDDETVCPDGCRYREHQCWPSRTCVKISYLCSIDSCPQGDLQLTCSGSCGPDEFACDSGHCIAQFYRCDGVSDCSTGNDESGCSPPVDPNVCSGHQFQCSVGTCISIFRVCDGFEHCLQGSDERDACSGACAADEFQCRSGYCLPEQYVCDGYHDCFDFNDDEANCATPAIPGFNQTCANHQFECPSEIFPCIDQAFRCDGISLCDGGGDEADCNGNCTADEFECASGACIPLDMRCNRRTDCAGGDDESGCIVSEGCRYREHQCPQTGACIPLLNLCPVGACPLGDDQPECSGLCGPDEFACEFGSCIAQSYRCDGVWDCFTGNDESECPPPADLGACAPHQFQCRPEVCIDVFTVCNGLINCLQEENDEKVCSGGCAHNEFQCKSGYCLPEEYVCDGYHDCFDFDDDEANCATPVIPEITSHCGTDGVNAYIPGSFVRSLFPGAGWRLSLVDDDLKPLANCFATMNYTSGFYDIILLDGMDECAANVNESDTEFVVTYKILLANPTTSRMISRNAQLPVVDFQCSYAKTGVVSMDQPLSALISHVEVNLGKTSSAFTMEMARYTSESFTNIENGQSITIGSPVYIGVRIDVDPETNFVLQGTSCVITPAENETGVVYSVVNGSCAVEDPLTADANVIYNLTDPRMFGLSFLGFGWTGNQDAEQELWISCDMNICQKTEGNNCNINCAPAEVFPMRKRSVTEGTNDAEKTISLGPFVIAPALLSDDHLVCDKDELGCSYMCGIDSTGAPYCFCPEEYFLTEDGKTCLAANQGTETLMEVSLISCLFLMIIFVILVWVTVMRKKVAKKMEI